MNTKYPSIWLKDGSKTLETELRWISGYDLIRNSLFFVFFVRSLPLKVCGGNFLGLWRLESIKLHQFVVSWSFWRLLSLNLVNPNVLCIRRLKFLKFLEVLGLDSSRAYVLLNLLWCCLRHGCLGVFQDALVVEMP